jgi:hypothetical protein
MQGVILLLFAKYYHLPFLRDVQTDCTRTGLGGYWVSGGWEGGWGMGLSVACKIPHLTLASFAPDPPQPKHHPFLRPAPFLLWPFPVLASRFFP